MRDIIILRVHRIITADQIEHEFTSFGWTLDEKNYKKKFVD